MEEVDRDTAFGHAHDVEAGGIGRGQFGGELGGDGTARVAEHPYRRRGLWHAEPALGRPDGIEGLVPAQLADPVGGVLSFVVRHHHGVARVDVAHDETRLALRSRLEGVAGVALGAEGVIGRLVGEQPGGCRRRLAQRLEHGDYRDRSATQFIGGDIEELSRLHRRVRPSFCERDGPRPQDGPGRVVGDRTAPLVEVIGRGQDWAGCPRARGRGLCIGVGARRGAGDAGGGGRS